MTDDKLFACVAAASQVFGFTVKPTDAFYDLGGDSLHAIDLAVRVQALLGVEVSPYEMVNAPSLESYFRKCIEAANGADHL